MQDVKPVDPDSDEAREIAAAFDGAVNMTAKQLRDWLDTDESRSVGQSGGAGEDESVGHEMGRHVVEVLEKGKGDRTGRDLAHMKKVNGYVSRHLEQRPSGDVEDTKWRYSLMNWGHDPLE